MENKTIYESIEELKNKMSIQEAQTKCVGLLVVAIREDESVNAMLLKNDGCVVRYGVLDESI